MGFLRALLTHHCILWAVGVKWGACQQPLDSRSFFDHSMSLCSHPFCFFVCLFVCELLPSFWFLLFFCSS